MSAQGGILRLVVICAVVVVFSILGLASTLLTRLEFDIDGLLLILICLMMGGLFSLMLVLLAKDAGWLAHLPLPGKKRVEEAPARNPAEPAAQKK